MLCTETPKRAATSEHESPGLTVYSKGGNGVHVAAKVAVRVTVGVIVMVGLAVAVTGTGVTSPVSTGSRDCKIRKIIAAARVISRASNAKAAGRLRVSSGSLLARTSGFFFELAVTSSSVPQTKHLVADSFKRVPHTGQSFTLVLFLSGLIIIGD